MPRIARIASEPPPRAAVARLLRGDKKRRDDALPWLLPLRIGEVTDGHPVDVPEALAALGTRD